MSIIMLSPFCVLLPLLAVSASAQLITDSYVQASSASFIDALGVGVGAGLVSARLDVRGGQITVEQSPAEVFLASAVQSGNVTTGSVQVWSAVTGASCSFTLPRAMVVHMRAYGAANALAGAHCGMRFTVDSAPYGNASWGDVIYYPNAGWTAWTMEREVSLAAGGHTVALDQVSNAASGCLSYSADYSAARLRVSGR